MIVDKVWHLFSRGAYDTAVFQAFKEVEVAVRDTGEYTEEYCDAELMKKAFDPKSGKLTDTTQTEGEMQATSALFAGAIGTYKKPSSNWNLSLTAIEAAEVIIFANHLLKIVYSRRQHQRLRDEN